MWTISKIMGVLLCFIPTFLLAQVDGKTCESLARTIGSGYNTYFTKKRLDTLKYTAKCDRSTSSQSGSIGIVAGGLDLDGDYSQAGSTESCAKEKNTLSSDAVEYRKIKNIFTQGVNVVSQCLDLAGRSWRITTKPYQDAVSVNIANLSASGGLLKSIDILSADKMTCADAPKRFPVAIKQDGVSFICKRTPKKYTSAGVNNAEASESTINLQLSDGPIGILLPGYIPAGLSQMNNQMMALDRETRLLRT